MASISNCKLVEIPKSSDARGNLSFVESQRHIPFSIQRIYYLYDVPAGAARAGHAHKNLHQLYIPVSGSFDIVLDDGANKKTISLNRPYFGLYVCPMIWRDINNFSSGSVCMTLASEYYDESDYFRDYQEFLNAVHNES